MEHLPLTPLAHPHHHYYVFKCVSSSLDQSHSQVLTKTKSISFKLQISHCKPENNLDVNVDTAYYMQHTPVYRLGMPHS